MTQPITATLRLAAAIVAILGLCLSAGCQAPTDAPGSVLNRGVGPEPETLDPQLARTLQAQHVLRDLFECLTSYSPAGELVPGAAENWEISDGGLVYVFSLRPEARWSNGEAVTAADFVAAFRRLVDPATAAFYAETLEPVRNAPEIVAGDLPADALGVEATGTHELTIRLSRPIPYFLSLLANPATCPVNAASRDALGGEFAKPGNLVSNGAYRLESWDLGSVITLSRNPYYWNDDATRIETVRHHVTEEPSAELYRYRAGELDVTSTVPSESFGQIRDERPGELRVAPSLGVYYYGYNLNHPELGNSPQLREALSLAIDRDTLVNEIIARGERPAWSIVPPGIDNYLPPRFPYADLNVEERQERARRLYAAAGYGSDRPLSIELRYNTSETHQRIALAIQAMWREVLGFEATLVNEEFRVLIANMRAMKITQIFRTNWTGDYNDAYTFLSVFETGNPSNMYAYSNAEYDSLLGRAAGQTDMGRRRLYLEEAERLLLSDHPVIPIYYYVSKHLVSPRVTGWQDNILDYHYSHHLGIEPAR